MTDTPPAPDPTPPAPPPAPPDPTPPAPPSPDPPAEPPGPRPDGAPDLAAVESETLRAYIRRMERQVRDYARADRERTDASRTELERATDRATAAEQRIAQLENDQLRMRLALKAFPEDAVRAEEAAKRAIGSTEEELWADLARLRELIGVGRGGQRPPVDFGSGSRLDGNGGASSSAGSGGAFDQQIRRAAGH